MARTYFWCLCAASCLSLVCSWLRWDSSSARRRTDLLRQCPNVRALRNFDLDGMMGHWYVLQYYASTEELPEYACMRSHFTFSEEDQHITMNFTYIFAEDPFRELLSGNITWIMPDFSTPAHWMHTEATYKDVYNTYILDSDYISWALIMHCAEKKKQPRYLSALLLSRRQNLGENVINFLREKLPRYDIDLSFMFPINQTGCDRTAIDKIRQSDINREFRITSNIKGYIPHLRVNSLNAENHPYYLSFNFT